ncbi:rhomboid family intramembrane serine protease [Celeribacter indicus]|uniref:Rhomboid family protein n=1 Tax=Celeribacter indicus TaxID=1208324 RepID=A0A0B5E0K1_9RHOB|nr:rhomboid family intramembrane serine protease [Celeribacter indicus]AJE45997.1 rhomboid family protein [Celeribacter indicus]SDW65816.1 Membrane associated serine protease, rhomboid family [Celeribacter indicus]
MFPIRDHNPSRRPALITYALIAVNVAVFLAVLPSYGDERALLPIYAEFSLIPARISAGDGFYTFFTSMFMHGGLLHLLGNMLFLWIFGDNLEDEFGHLRYLGFYLLCGLAAGLAQYLAAPFARVPMVGASGAIAGVMGGYLLLFPRARVDVLFIFIIFFKVIPLPAWVMLGVWFAFQLLGGVEADLEAGGVAYLAHLGGFVAGVALSLPVWRRLGGRGFWRRSRGRPPHPQARYRFTETSVPAVRRRR